MDQPSNPPKIITIAYTREIEEKDKKESNEITKNLEATEEEEAETEKCEREKNKKPITNNNKGQ
jgi:hypothetical protein